MLKEKGADVHVAETRLEKIQDVSGTRGSDMGYPNRAFQTRNVVCFRYVWWLRWLPKLTR